MNKCQYGGIFFLLLLLVRSCEMKWICSPGPGIKCKHIEMRCYCCHYLLYLPSKILIQQHTFFSSVDAIVCPCIKTIICRCSGYSYAGHTVQTDWLSVRGHSNLNYFNEIVLKIRWQSTNSNSLLRSLVSQFLFFAFSFGLIDNLLTHTHIHNARPCIPQQYHILTAIRHECVK